MRFICGVLEQSRVAWEGAGWVGKFLCKKIYHPRGRGGGTHRTDSWTNEPLHKGATFKTIKLSPPRGVASYSLIQGTSEKFSLGVVQNSSD